MEKNKKGIKMPWNKQLISSNPCNSLRRKRKKEQKRLGIGNSFLVTPAQITQSILLPTQPHLKMVMSTNPLGIAILNPYP
jgi:hypothetical protein